MVRSSAAPARTSSQSRGFYQIIADIIDVELKMEELPVASFLCHRVYDLGKLKGAGLAVPATPLVEGLRKHVESML